MQVNNLKAYLANIGMNLREFSEMVDCNYTHLSSVLAGRRRAGNRLAKDISEATDGIINLETKPKRRHLRKASEQKGEENIPVSLN